MNSIVNFAGDMNSAERLEELVALINMLTYAEEIAKSVGSNSATQHIKLASEALADDFACSSPNDKLTTDTIRKAAMSTSGNC